MALWLRLVKRERQEAATNRTAEEGRGRENEAGAGENIALEEAVGGVENEENKTVKEIADEALNPHCWHDDANETNTANEIETAEMQQVLAAAQKTLTPTKNADETSGQTQR